MCIEILYIIILLFQFLVNFRHFYRNVTTYFVFVPDKLLKKIHSLCIEKSTRKSLFSRQEILFSIFIPQDHPLKQQQHLTVTNYKFYSLLFFLSH